MARSLYTRIIKGATNAPDEDLDEIEDLMRNTIFHSTLDWQTKEELEHAARLAQAMLREIRKEEQVG